MNPPGMWCNPPPPGLDDEAKKESPERAIDKIDPYLKSTEYIKYEKRRRSRSRSRHRRRRSRSRSRRRHRHRRKYSSSRSRSRSRSRSHRRHKRSRRSRSRSSRRRHRRPKEPEEPKPVLEPEDEDDEEDDSNENAFKNDGSFLEMFKKLQEDKLKEKAAAEEAATQNSKAAALAVGKRRGGKILKTGMVQKNKTSAQQDGESEDAWTLYMKEVKRYKEACCDDDSKTRLLVK